MASPPKISLPGNGLRLLACQPASSLQLVLNAGPRCSRSLKRAPGGMIDVEFLVQLFQIKYGEKLPEVLRNNTWEALEAAGNRVLVPRLSRTRGVADRASELKRFIERRVPDGPVHLSSTGVQEVTTLRQEIAAAASSGLPPAELTSTLDALTARFKSVIDDELGLRST